MSKRRKKSGKRKRNPNRILRQQRKRQSRPWWQGIPNQPLTPPDFAIGPKRGGKYSRRRWDEESKRELASQQNLREHSSNGTSEVFVCLLDK